MGCLLGGSYIQANALARREVSLGHINSETLIRKLRGRVNLPQLVSRPVMCWRSDLKLPRADGVRYTNLIVTSVFDKRIGLSVAGKRVLSTPKGR